MTQLIHKQLLSRALARGFLSQSEVLEITRRLEAAAAGGSEPPSLSRVLREVGIAADAIAALEDQSLVGRKLGNFEITGVLGYGGMATVYRARQLGLDREVAVKVFDVRFALSEKDVERFRREARAACKLDHPHVVQPIDFGQDGPILFLAMELAPGGSAESRLEREGPFSERDTLETIACIANALRYAAARGLVHRDIKPANILYSSSGTPKLADLGIALETGAARLTEGQGAVVGTAHYMAPEQALAKPLDTKADVYSLGITAFDMLAGAPPFDADSPLLVVAQHLRAPFPDVRERRPEVSAATAALLERMCAKEPERRPSPEEVENTARALLYGGTAAGRATAAALAPAAAAPAPAAELRVKDLSTERVPVEGPPPGALRSSRPTGPGAGAGDAASTAGAGALPARRRRAARALAIVAGAAFALAGIAAALLHYTGTLDRAPAIDEAAEARGIAELAAVLFARRASDGGFGEQAGEPADPWVTAQGLEALLLLENPLWKPELARMLARLPALALDGAATGDAPGFAGFPYLVATDNVACLEATAAVGRAVALAQGRVEADVRPLARDLFEYLLRTQTAEGAWASIPVLGTEGVMTSATADALSALAVLAVALGEEKRAAPALRRGSDWLAALYDADGRFFNVNPRRLTGADRGVAGLNEAAALALLEARDVCRRAGEPESARAAEVLRAVAAGFDARDIAPDVVAEAAMEDYRFARHLPPRYRTSATEFAWEPFTWRLVLAERLAREPGAPRAGEWAACAARLRSHIPAIAARFRENPTNWKVAEALMGPACVYAARVQGGRCGLVDLVRR